MTTNLDLKSFFLGAIVVLLFMLVLIQFSSNGRYQVAGVDRMGPVVIDTRTGVVKQLVGSDGAKYYYQFGLSFEQLESTPTSNP